MDLKKLLKEKTDIETQLEIIDSQEAEIMEMLNKVNAEINIVIDEPVKAARKLAGKDTGTVDVLVQGVMVKHCLTKKVTWDKEKMTEIWNRIKDAGDDPADYMDEETSYKVKEKKYKSFPKEIRKVFQAARNEGTQKPKITFDTDWR